MKTVCQITDAAVIITLKFAMRCGPLPCIHTGKKFRDKLMDWSLEKQVIVCYLPTYSPELNVIEILWRKVKYAWLNLQSIMSCGEFQKELKRVLDAVGKKYMITFV